MTSLAPGAALALPFAWSGGSYPGGDGGTTTPGMAYPSCATTLGVGEECLVVATVSATNAGTYTSEVNLD